LKLADDGSSNIFSLGDPSFGIDFTGSPALPAAAAVARSLLRS
jgi:hypothetical protein